MLTEINVYSLVASLSGKNRDCRGGSFLLYVKDIYIGDARRYYSNLHQVATLTNEGVSQAAGLVSGVPFIWGTEKGSGWDMLVFCFCLFW